MFPTSYQCVTGLLILDYGYVNFLSEALQFERKPINYNGYCEIFYGSIPLVIDPNVVYSSANNMGINKSLKVLFLLLVIRFNATKLPLNSYIGWEKAIYLFSQY